MREENFYFFAQALLTYLLPFSGLRETDSRKEQLANYDLKKLLAFSITTQLRSSVVGGRKIHASAQFNSEGSLIRSRVGVEAIAHD